MLTLRDLKDDRGVRRIANTDPDGPDFLEQVNQAIRRAMRRGDFPGTLVPIYLCVRAGCVVWPDYVQDVRALAWCGGDFKAENMWGGFLPRGRGMSWRGGLNWVRGGDCQRYMVAQANSSVYQDIQGDGRYVRAYYRCNQDLNKTITIFGTDNNGQVLQHLDTNNNYVPGLVLALAAPWASTSTYVRKIDYVILDSMQCPVNLYAYNASANVLEDLAQYEPGETRPSFHRTQITMPGNILGGQSCGSCCPGKTGVTALVKLRFKPLKFDTDIAFIDNVEAIKYLIQSERFGEAGDRGNAQAYLADAIAELNRQLEDEEPDTAFPAVNDVFAGATFNNRCF
jgi:hypothetical protein